MTAAADQLSVIDEVRRALGRSVSARPAPLEPFTESSFQIEPAAIVERFIAEVKAVRGSVQVTDASRLVPTILEICRQSPGEIAISGSAFLLEIELPSQLAAQGNAAFVAEGTDHRELVARLEGAGAGITCVDYALAETGTLAVSSEEPNALLVSLLPPVHIAVVRKSQIYASLDEVIGRIGAERMTGSSVARSVSFITGPSRTSDVELVLSIGVHGPKELHVIVVA